MYGKGLCAVGSVVQVLPTNLAQNFHHHNYFYHNYYITTTAYLLPQLQVQHIS